MSIGISSNYFVCICSADIDASWLTDPVRRSSWVKDTVDDVLKKGVDGVNVDFEDVINATDRERREGLTTLIADLVSALKKISASYQVNMWRCFMIVISNG
jgi:hypothetical protein